ncbi:hypothetical protein [Streptomyces hydrogenans]|uniref:hypothetical protein n=1 Tax=Streptomyces hydrogenans TaxID=1873719 RepID=UPI00344839A6
MELLAVVVREGVDAVRAGAGAPARERRRGAEHGWAREDGWAPPVRGARPSGAA